jgi:hypothetical protein
MLFERSETLDTSVTDAVLTWTCLTVHLFDVAGKTVSPRLSYVTDCCKKKRRPFGNEWSYSLRNPLYFMRLHIVYQYRDALYQLLSESMLHQLLIRLLPHRNKKR